MNHYECCICGRNENGTVLLFHPFTVAYKDVVIENDSASDEKICLDCLGVSTMEDENEKKRYN